MPAPAPLSLFQSIASHPATSVPTLLSSTLPASSSRPGTTITSQVNGASSCIFTCSFPSTRRQTRPRKNHLRSKQLSRNVSPEVPAPSPPQVRDPLLLDELAGRISDEISADTIQLVPLLVREGSGLLTIEEENEKEDGQLPLMEPVSLPITEVGDASHPRAASDTEVILGPKLLIQLSLYLGALLVVQTVCALLFFGGEGLDTKDESVSERSRSNKKTGLSTWWVGVEKKQEIHLGREVGPNASDLADKVAEIRTMANEARVAEANETVQGVEGAVGITGGVKQEVSQRLKRLTKGTFQVVMHKYISLKSNTADETGKPSFRRKSKIGRYRAALNRKTPKGFNGTGKKVPTGVTTDTEDRSKGTERPAVDRGTVVGGLEASVVSQVGLVDGSLTEKGDIADRNRGCSGDIITKEGSSKKFHDHHSNWWLKLPYVLGIYLHRASGGKNHRGLYTLKINSHSVGNSLPVTIVFEDRVDATNLCYLLESYFEDLSDVRADIVPITTQELVGAIEEKSINAMVIKKGQLRLYAGQVLSEVEAQLQSIVDQNLN